MWVLKRRIEAGYGLGLLTKPLTSKTAERKGNEFLKVGCVSLQGYRMAMEDTHSIVLSLPSHPNTSMIGVYDGHGGSEVSEFLARRLPTVIDNLVDVHNHAELEKALIELDKEVLAQGLSIGGSAATFAIIEVLQRGESSGQTTKVTIGNVGDSRIVLGENFGESFQAMTRDHVPTVLEEARRVEEAGGEVERERKRIRVGEQSLRLSRAFGDKAFKIPTTLPPHKQQVTPIPDCSTFMMEPSSFLLLACDGIFEGMTRDAVVAFIRDKITDVDTGGQPTTKSYNCVDPVEVLVGLCDEAVRGGSQDNMTSILVFLSNGASYHSDQSEYMPGPYEDGKGHAEFQEAYVKDAQKNNHTLEEALEKLKKTQEKPFQKVGSSKYRYNEKPNELSKKKLGTSLEIRKGDSNEDHDETGDDEDIEDDEEVYNQDLLDNIHPLARSLELVRSPTRNPTTTTSCNGRKRAFYDDEG